MDLHTLYLAQTCFLAATAVMLWVSRSDADRRNGMRTWMLAITAQALAYALLALPHALPPVLVAVAGNGAGAASVALFFVAIRRFADRPFDRRLLVALVAAVTVVGGATADHPVGATIFNGFAYAGWQWLNALTLWRDKRPETARVQRVVASLYACMGLVLPVRAAALLVVEGWKTDIVQIQAWQLPVFVFGFFYLVITNLGFVLMCKMRAEAETHLQARTDDLTGLGNRRALDERIGRALSGAQSAGQPFAIVMVDVDRVKAINDTHGHAVGDATLAAFARRLAGALRGRDHAFRYGGEEFCVLLAEADPAHARTRADSLREDIARPHDGAITSVTASLGVTTWRPGDTADAMFRRADRALYAAKAGGRDRVEVG